MELPRANTMEELRTVLLWLAEKTGDQLQINWHSP
jgi:hypothetical protein